MTNGVFERLSMLVPLIAAGGMNKTVVADEKYKMTVYKVPSANPRKYIIRVDIKPLEEK